MSVFGQNFAPQQDHVAVQFRTLVEEDHPEQTYQEFLEKYGELVPQEFMMNHGLHFDLILRKVKFGNEYVSDFVYLTKSSVRYHCVLVELEKPTSRYFRNDGRTLHRDFTAAVEQMNDWRSWLSDTQNAEYFEKTTLGFLLKPMLSNIVDFKFVLVHGRRTDSAGTDSRKRKIAAYERPDFRIMSYDSLTENIRNRCKCYVGVKYSDHVEILSEEFAGEGMFGWLTPEQIRVNTRLRAELESWRGKINSYQMVNGQSVRCVDHYLDSTP